jgi:hypothetical protein
MVCRLSEQGAALLRPCKRDPRGHEASRVVTMRVERHGMQ